MWRDNKTSFDMHFFNRADNFGYVAYVMLRDAWKRLLYNFWRRIFKRRRQISATVSFKPVYDGPGKALHEITLFSASKYFVSMIFIVCCWWSDVEWQSDWTVFVTDSQLSQHGVVFFFPFIYFFYYYWVTHITLTQHINITITSHFTTTHSHSFIH